VGEEGKCLGKITQTLYAHMDKWKKKWHETGYEV
jgi:hypothetical protein